jgi:hypothetical protein
MQNAAGGRVSVQSDDRNDSYHSIISELESLIVHVEAGMKLIESVIAREQVPGNQEVAADVVVLDDVTPRYVWANAALRTCSADLGTALHFLLDSRTSKHGTGGAADCAHPPVATIRRA